MSGDLRPKDRSPQGPTLLDDLDRLPVDAAVDMVCSALRSDARLLTHRVSERLSQLEERSRSATMATKLLDAWATKKQLSAADRDEIHSLTSIACGAAQAGPAVFALIGRDLGVVGAMIVTPALALTRRDGLARQAAAQGVAAWGPEQRWREYDGMCPRDAFVSGLVEQFVALGEVDQAMSVARVWPPARTALGDLSAALTLRSDLTGLRHLAEPYDSRGSLYQHMLKTVAQTSRSMQARGESVAAWLLSISPSIERLQLLKVCTEPRCWQRRLASAIEVVVNASEAPWLGEFLVGEPQAPQRLADLVRRAGRRPKTQLQALKSLEKLDAAYGFAVGCEMLLDDLQRGDALCSAQSVKRQVAQLRRAEGAMSAIGLTDQWIELVRRELGDQSVALRALR
ncbi:MAG: hypothetical protein CMH53_08860 [Myxococcales bacterium]|nr:hypothetical protein [Myxococcales bacterium]